MPRSRTLRLLERAFAELSALGWTPQELRLVLRSGKGMDAARDADIEAKFRAGMTYTQIASCYALTRERVRQILKRRGLGRKDGGASVRALFVCKLAEVEMAQRKERRKKRLDEFCVRVFGCDFDAVKAINNGIHWRDLGSPANQYFNQRRSAMNRHIGWAISLPEWWNAWRQSGKYHLRGRGRDRFCMARINDNGPYAVGNVKICTNLENISEGYEIRRAKTAGEISGYDNRAWHALYLRESGLKMKEVAERLGTKETTAAQFCSDARRWRREGVSPPVMQGAA